MSDLTHFDDQGSARMVDVGGKPVSQRMARASGEVVMDAATLTRIVDRKLEKGDVLAVAQVAGIMASKRTAELIPMCHPLGLDSVTIEFQAIDDATLRIEATVKNNGQTGVEMEALTAVTVAALTIYDMCKSIDRRMTVNEVRLEEKRGGKSGHFLRTPAKE